MVCCEILPLSNNQNGSGPPRATMILTVSGATMAPSVAAKIASMGAVPLEHTIELFVLEVRTPVSSQTGVSSVLSGCWYVVAFTLVIHTADTDHAVSRLTTDGQMQGYVRIGKVFLSEAA